MVKGSAVLFFPIPVYAINDNLYMTPPHFLYCMTTYPYSFRQITAFAKSLHTVVVVEKNLKMFPLPLSGVEKACCY